MVTAARQIRRAGSLGGFIRLRPDRGRPKPRRLRRGGFTLVELLVVIAVIGVLMGLLLSAVSRAKRVAREKACINNMRQIYVALALYANDHDGYFPVEPTEHNPHPGLLSQLNVKPTGSMMSIFYCPAADVMERYARDTEHYAPTGESDSVIDTPENREAGNISYVYWSFRANKPGWRHTHYFKPRILRQGGAIALEPDNPCEDATVAETWLLSEWFRCSAPFPHDRRHARGLNVLFLDGHIDLVLGRPRDSYR